MNGRIRASVAATCGVVGVVGLLLVVVGQWAERVVFEEGKVAAAAGAALDDPEVIASLADQLAEAVVEVADLAGRLDDRDALGRVVTAIGGSVGSGPGAAATQIEEWLSERLERALSDDRTQRGLTALVEQAHRVALRVLDDEPVAPRLSVTDDQVTLNLLPLVVDGLELVQERGALPGLDLPDLDLDDDAVAHREQLSAALGRKVPEGFAQLVVYRGDAVGSAGAGVAAARDVALQARRAVAVVALATVAALATTIGLARRRRRAAGRTAAGVAALFTLAALTLARVVANAPSILDDPGAARAVSLIGSSLTSGLSAALWAGAVVCGVAAISLIAPWRTGRAAEPSP